MLKTFYTIFSATAVTHTTMAVSLDNLALADTAVEVQGA